MSACSSKGVELIRRERERQVKAGNTAEGDDYHDCGELASAAICYAKAKHSGVSEPSEWPWDSCEWKPRDRVRNLVRAGALIAAEIDRQIRDGTMLEEPDAGWMSEAALAAGDGPKPSPGDTTERERAILAEHYLDEAEAMIKRPHLGPGNLIVRIRTAIEELKRAEMWAAMNAAESDDDMPF